MRLHQLNHLRQLFQAVKRLMWLNIVLCAKFNTLSHVIAGWEVLALFLSLLYLKPLTSVIGAFHSIFAQSDIQCVEL